MRGVYHNDESWYHYAMELHTIVSLSTQLWEDPMWTNKQHVMSRLAVRGHHVLYIDPLIRVRTLSTSGIDSVEY